MSDVFTPSTESILDVIASRCEGAHFVGNQLRARCPLHKGQSDTSLAVTLEGGKVLITCHAGCATESVLDEMNLTYEDLFLQRPTKYLTNKRIARVYDYYDEKGTLRFQTLRYEPKDFKQRQPDGKGGWIWNLKGINLVPYRLPELIHAVANDVTVYICEGEKDVEALHEIGLAATTSPMGAGKWRAEYSSYLRGARVAILPDRDEPGRKHARQVAESLQGIATRIQILELPNLPEKGDISDWLDAGHTHDELQQLLATASIWDPVAEWEVPLPLPSLLPEVPVMTADMLPTGIRAWLTDIADRVQCPLEYVAVSAMVAIAAVIGRRIAIYPKRHDDWLVFPNLWSMLIGRPGVLKSPAMVEAMKPLDRLVSQAREDYSKAMEEYTIASSKYVAQHKANQAEMSKAAKDNNNARMDQLTAQLKELIQSAPEQPTVHRYKTNDSTVEKLHELLAENPNGLLLFRDELAGFLYALEKPGREGDREFYLECWNGNGRFTLDRIGRGTIQSNGLCLSLLGSIQPGKLTEYVTGTLTGGSGDDGLLQRVQLAVWPDTPPTWNNVDRWPDTAAKQCVWTIFQRLVSIQREHIAKPDSSMFEQDDPPKPDSAAFEQDHPPGIRFAPPAQDIFDRWRANLETRLRSGDLHPAMEAHLAKYRSLMPTLALLLHLTFHAHQGDFVPGCITPVSEHAANTAIRWCEFLEKHALRIYAGDINRDQHRAHALAKRICDGDVSDGDTVRSVYRRQWSMLRTPEDVHAALAVLESLSWVRVEAENTAGRSRDIIRINPAITGEQNLADTVRPTDTADTSLSEGDHPLPLVSKVSGQLKNDAENVHPEAPEEEKSEKVPSLSTDSTDTSLNGPEDEEFVEWTA